MMAKEILIDNILRKGFLPEFLNNDISDPSGLFLNEVNLNKNLSCVK